MNAAALVVAVMIAAQSDVADWREAEQGILENHVQLTFADRFEKAGEAYFSPDDSKVIFQATEAAKAGEHAVEFYGMFIADVTRDEKGAITGLANIKRISPPGSANTCGWFHPSEPNRVIFATTLGPPTESTPPGYQRGTGRYRWMFPPEMRIVSCDLRSADGTPESLTVLASAEDAYVAEGSYSADERHLIFCSLESNQGDLFTIDLANDVKTRIVSAAGYDGGPFFSPDDQRVCYRSDRAGNNLLQIYVADLAFNDAGTIVGIEREYQLTDNEHVNWCPFWHPDARHLVYATSELGHQNYEVFVIDADPGHLPGSSGSIKYGTRKRRVTHAEGADVLPAFSSDGKAMMWTSKRGEDGSTQLWVADFVFDLDGDHVVVPGIDRQRDSRPDEIHVMDEETGLTYIYHRGTHELWAYNPLTHEKRLVSDQAEMKRAMILFQQDREEQGSRPK